MPDSQRRLTRSSTPRSAPGIVHLGLGAFFRGFGAVYIEDAVKASGGDWGIVGVSLKSPTTRDQLIPQDNVYQVVTLYPDGSEDLHQVEIVQDVLVAPEAPDKVLNLMADAAIRIVSLTITEKGYCHDQATGQINWRHPDILHDLAQDLPVSAPGFIVRALQRRRNEGTPPFTVLTCDNLPENGRLVSAIVLDFARRLDPALADWISRNGRFPCTMVDRITPATKPEDVDRLAEKTGVLDASPVVCEPFRQWVVEDDFVPDYGAGARPDLAAAGVELVSDVSAYEHMKLRMLNGTHSSLAYLGYLAGHETIAETVADPIFAAYVKNLWRREIMPSFTAPPGVDLGTYTAALFERYRNPSIRHRTWQIAMDGSQKLPQRILGTLKDDLASNVPCLGLITAVAAWMVYVGGTDLKGQPIDVRDPLSSRLKNLSDSADAPAEKVAALLSMTDIFDRDLADRLQPDLETAYANLVTRGVRGTLEALS